MDFESLIMKISTGAEVHQLELLPHLCHEDKKMRYKSNYRFAQAYSQVANYKSAKVFIERAWMLSDFSETVLLLYKQICEQLDDIESLGSVYKRLGINAARNGQADQALHYFNQWQYVYATHRHLDKYSYDPDILNAVETLAQPLKFNNNPERTSKTGRKIRLAYLVFGITHANSVLVKIIKTFAHFHDKSLFEIAFFLPESLSMLNESGNRIVEFNQFCKSCGVKVFSAPDSSKDGRLVYCARQIYAFQPDMLVTSAALADFEHYFIALLQPAPIVVGLLQGPPAQFVAPGLDHAISWSRHPLIDSPLNTTLVRLGVELPSRSSTPPFRRHTLNIPEEANVMMSAGRQMKFQDGEFWRHIIKLLTAHDQLYFVVVGARMDQIAILNDLDISEVEGRMRFLGWRSDCVSLLTIADLLVDTYPSGGGHVLIDAMALGVPFISFENDYLHAFDQTDWSVAEEFVDIPELIVPRGDFGRFMDVAGKLISDKEYRFRMSELCAREVRLSMPTPEKGVQVLEKVYMQLINSTSDSSKHISRLSLSPAGQRVSFIQKCKKAVMCFSKLRQPVNH